MKTIKKFGLTFKGSDGIYTALLSQREFRIWESKKGYKRLNNTIYPLGFTNDDTVYIKEIRNHLTGNPIELTYYKEDEL